MEGGCNGNCKRLGEQGVSNANIIKESKKLGIVVQTKHPSGEGTV